MKTTLMTTSKLTTLALVSIMLSVSAIAQTRKIIFVCEHGAAKSVIAASYFNKLAKERNLDYVAECRGTSPDSVVSLKTQEGLTKDNVYDTNTRPTKLQISDTTNVERIILFTPPPPYLNTNIKTENWSDIENVDAEYSKRRDAILKKINILLDSLEKN
jgi:arsenate reductase (thioredoxin)